jgi:hypothetical protein
VIEIREWSNPMSEKKPVIRPLTRSRGNCPVCGKPSYSMTGTHPQCAVARADALTRENRKKSAQAAATVKRKSWSKACPKCKRELPARRIACECGHTFAIAR